MDLNEGEDDENYSKEIESESLPLRTTDKIDKVTDALEEKSQNEYKKLIKKIYIILFIVALFLLLIILIYAKYSKKEDNDYYLKIYEPQNKTAESYIKRRIKNITNDTKKNIAFIYKRITGNGISRFMAVIGDYFIKSEKYNVYFITDPQREIELKYNEKIKRIYAFNNSALIKKVIKEEKIDFLILNNVFSPYIIKKYKLLGLKVIGIFHGVFLSSIFNNSTKLYQKWKHLKLYDAFIHLTIDDYYFYSKLGFNNNIFIPNLYTFNPYETPSSNLTGHNLMMLGRLTDKKKGVIYAIKAMRLVVNEVPDARLKLVSSDGIDEVCLNLIKNLNLTNHIFNVSFTPNISEIFLNSSVFVFTSLTEAFPMALNEAKSHGLPCVTFDVSYSIPLQTGVIKVDTFNYERLAKEIIKLLKNYNYRIEMGYKAKLSLERFKNEETTELWGRLFKSLDNGKDEFQKLRKEIENKYYNESIAEEHMIRQMKYIKIYNKFIGCHSLKNMTNINYLNKMKECH